MRDQAETLRMMVKQSSQEARTKAIAVISGKGGVGKSNFSLNFSLMLSRHGFNVLLFDMDIGMGNIDILLGQSSNTTIVDMFNKGLSLRDLIRKGPDNLSFIAGGTGLTKIFEMDIEKVQYFVEQIQKISLEYDYIIFDMGAGISEDRLQFLMSVHEIIVITTPEPTAITDAYATIKYIYLQDKNIPFYLVVNRAGTEKEGNDTLARLTKVIKQFLGKEIMKLGMLPEDRTVSKAVVKQTPFLLLDPSTKISRAMREIVERYIANSFETEKPSTSFSFIAKLRQFFLER